MRKFFVKLYLNLVWGYDWITFFQRREKLERGVSPLRRLFYRYHLDRSQQKNGAFIGHNARFASRPHFPHGLKGVFISEGAVIGKDAVIFHQVTIGSNTAAGSKRQGAPRIGDCCYIGAGAKIIGGITIGDNVRIGANCVVTEDIPSNSTVVLPKPRILAKEMNENHYVSYKNFNKD